MHVTDKINLVDPCTSDHSIWRCQLAWYLLPAPELQQISCTLQLSIARTDRRTDRRSDTVPLHRRSLLEAGNVNKWWETGANNLDFSITTTHSPINQSEELQCLNASKASVGSVELAYYTYSRRFRSQSSGRCPCTEYRSAWERSCPTHMSCSSPDKLHSPVFSYLVFLFKSVLIN